VQEGDSRKARCSCRIHVLFGQLLALGPATMTALIEGMADPTLTDTAADRAALQVCSRCCTHPDQGCSFTEKGVLQKLVPASQLTRASFSPKASFKQAWKCVRADWDCSLGGLPGFTKAAFFASFAKCGPQVAKEYFCKVAKGYFAKTLPNSMGFLWRKALPGWGGPRGGAAAAPPCDAPHTGGGGRAGLSNPFLVPGFILTRSRAGPSEVDVGTRVLVVSSRVRFQVSKSKVLSTPTAPGSRNATPSPTEALAGSLGRLAVALRDSRDAGWAPGVT